MFTTPWGTYVYVRIPFGLTNVGVTFQRAMGVAFTNIINTIMVVHQDELTIYSKRAKDHVEYIENIFLQDLEYGISLNPKKFPFYCNRRKVVGSHSVQIWSQN